jgi:hypothetical protein
MQFPIGTLMIFSEDDAFILRKFNGATWDFVRTMTKEEAIRIGY